MSKNIIIQEGGTSCQFTAKKLKTDQVGGGTCLWVLEDETTLTKKKITEEGTYKASDEGYYGYSEVEVDVTGTTQTKRITQNGTYKAEDDGLMGYSKVKVNVRGGNGSADSSGKPRTTFDSDGNVENAPGGIGSSVVGTDPDTGEWITVGVDSGGNIVTTPIPADIEIITDPTKISYTDGEAISFTGIVVGLKTKSENTFTNVTYPNGHIPTQELIFPVTVAHVGSGGEGSVSSDYNTNMYQPINFTFGDCSGSSHFPDGGYDTTLYDTENDVKIFIAKYGSGSAYAYHYNWVADHPFTVIHTYKRFDSSGTQINEQHDTITSVQKTVRGKTIYHATFVVDHSTDSEKPINAYGTPNDDDLYMVMYGSISGTVEIPVQWRSPYSGDIFEDSFNITVVGSTESGSGSGSTDGGGYSDDSGGSSSGGGGGF